jgi:hypothetical protein
MKKPRISKFKGLWYCRTSFGYCGIGYTPKSAFADWARYE